MIEIRLETERKFELTVTGHATAEEGEEHTLVCNSVSVLAQGMAYCLTKYEKDHDALLGLDYRPEKGDLLIRAYPEEWARAAVRKRMQIYGDGLEMMAICYAQYIHMTWNGEEIRTQTEEETEDERV